jgi:ribosomal protein L11 methylase PrmA
MKQHSSQIGSSFRDPSGFIFVRDGQFYRQINHCYKDNYDKLNTSGLYHELAQAGLLVTHQELSPDKTQSEHAYKVIKPEQVPFISYPYEWCFSQLKDAALCTLAIQKKALEHGMSLKDASAYNIQFIDSRPVFIDTLSFETYQKGQLWPAYKQFCQHFLAPLALMSFTDIQLAKLSRIFIDGVDLPLASRLLPFRTRFIFSIFSNIHLQAKVQRKYADKKVDVQSRKMSLFQFKALINSLESAVKKLKLKTQKSEWGDYYSFTNYNETAMDQKHQLVEEFVSLAKPRTVWDIGANNGEFSRIATQTAEAVVAFDVDYNAVEKHYLFNQANDQKSVYPLVLDLTNPSSAIGFGNTERMSINQRGPVDMLMALAVIHHLAISNNLPLAKIAQWMATISTHLIIEFVPKEDSKVQILLQNREDIFPNYHQEGFEKAFTTYFEIIRLQKIENSKRILYLMKVR